jgi:ERCC4-related helicase
VITENAGYMRIQESSQLRAEFVRSFLESVDKPYWELVSPVGSGKTHLTRVLVDNLLSENPNGKILLIAPSPLLSQWQYFLSSRDEGSPSPRHPTVVDRKLYLELESRVTGNETLWPVPGIILVGLDFAKREDIAASLNKVTWDLVIFDESHLLKGQRRKLFDQLTQLGTARRVLLLTATPIFLPNVVRKTIRMRDAVDAHRARRLTWVFYHRSEGENNLFDLGKNFAEALAKKGKGGRLQAANIYRAFSSSIYSAEIMLRRIREGWLTMRAKLAHNMALTSEDMQRSIAGTESLIEDFEDTEDAAFTSTIDPQGFLSLYQRLEMLLERFEENRSDSKLDAFAAYLKHSLEIEGKTHILVWTSLANTVSYLESSVQVLERQVFRFTGSVEPAERQRSMGIFREKGGVMIATNVGLEGVDFGYCDECINYDLPRKVRSFEQRWGRFFRIGGKEDFRMVILRDQRGGLGWEEDVINRIAKQVSIRQATFTVSPAESY